MDVEDKEAVLKKKLNKYLLEAFKMGNVCGFQHFSMYLRGKEELGLTVYHEPQISSRRCSILNNTGTAYSFGESLTSSKLPYDQQALVLSQGTQMALSGMRDKGVGLPPASPSDNEQHSSANASNSTLFLIAGYSRYSCPYVWVRSNHERLMKMAEEPGDVAKDNPLRLKTTTMWQEKEVHIWDIIAELIKLCMYPAPRNPFAVDMNYFLSLPTNQQVISSAAMMSCLQKIAYASYEEKPYIEKVLDELVVVSRLHFTALLSLVKSNRLPVLQQHQQQQQRQQAKSKRGAFAHSRDRYPSGEQLPVNRQEVHDNMMVHSTKGVYTPQGSAQRGFPGYGFTPAPSLF